MSLSQPREERAEPGVPAVTVPVVGRVTTRIELPTRTIVKVLLTLGILWFLAKIWTILLLLFIAALLAAAVQPVVVRLERHGLRRPLAVAIVFLILIAAIAGLLLVLIPPLINEGQQFATALPTYIKDAEGLLKQNQVLYNRLQGLANQGAANPSSILAGFLRFGAGLIGAISNTLIILVLAIYILLDGKSIVRWLTRDLPAGQRAKLDRAIPELVSVISGYVAGQVITSLLFGIFSFLVLTVSGVPQALLLAIVAALADAIPIAGVIIATAPAVLLAWTQSALAAIVVLVAYIAYQQVENHLIVPQVYKKTLQVSSFAILVAVLIGGQLLGVVGVLIALPIAAAVPVIERIWLGDVNEAAREAISGQDRLPDEA